MIFKIQYFTWVFSSLLLFLFTGTHAQLKKPAFSVYAGTNVSTGEKSPFWIVSGNQGSYHSSPLGASAGILIENKDSVNHFIGFNYGIEMLNRYNEKGYDFRFQQAYGEIRIWEIIIRAGRKAELIGNHDSLMSTGGTVWSGNAPPMPKIAISSNGYVDVPFTKGWVKLNGYMAHGWFEKNRFVKDLLLHQKYLYVKVGGDSKINVSYGLQHFAQWGGISPVERYGELPSDWDAFKKVFLAKSGTPGTVDTNEIINRLGNHLGSRNYGLDFKFENGSTGIYYQTIFEDNSGRNDKISRDGLWGVWFGFKDKEKIVNHILYEFLNTSYQSGPAHNIGDSVLGGNDNYFNNYIYHTGWTYMGYTLGTPMITSPILARGDKIAILNNRVTAHHVGIAGVISKKIPYQTFFTYSINRGTYSNPFPSAKDQFSWFGKARIPLNNKELFLDAALALDIGKMYGNNMGMILQICKVF